MPPGRGLVLVMTGTTPGTVRLKLCGPSLDIELVAVTAIVETAIAFGVPVSRPPALRLAHPGNPVADQVIGAVPFAAN